MCESVVMASKAALIQFENGDLQIVNSSTLTDFNEDQSLPYYSICDWKRVGSRKSAAFTVKVLRIAGKQVTFI